MTIFKKALIVSLAFAMSIGTGAIALANIKSSDVKQTNAASNYTRGTVLYKELSNDPDGGSSNGQTVPYYFQLSDLSSTAYSGSRLTESLNGDTLSVTIGENASSKMWHAMYVPYTYTYSLPAYSSVTLTFNHTFRSTRDTSDGAADHVAEFLFMGTKNASIAPRLQVDNDHASSTSIFINNSSTDNYGAVRVNSSSGGTVSSGDKTVTTVELINDSNTAVSQTVRFALFAYIESSKYAHTWTATFNITSVSKSSKQYSAYIVKSGSAYKYMYESTSTALANVENNCTLYFVKNFSIEGGLLVGPKSQISYTIDMNGYTWTRTGSGASAFNLNDGNTVTIRNGTIVANDGTTCAIYVNPNASLTLTNVSVINQNTANASFGIDMTVAGASVTLNNSTVSGNQAAVRVANGCSFTANGSTLNGNNYSVYAQSTNAYNTLKFGANCSLNNRVYVDAVSHTYIYGYSGVNTYTGTNPITFEFGTMPGVGTAFMSVLSSQGYSKFKIYNLAAYYELYQPSVTTVAYRYKTFTVSYSLTNLTRDGGSSATHQSNFQCTLSPSDAILYALPSSITVTCAGSTLSLTTHYTYNSSTGLVTIKSSAINGNISITAAGVKTDVGYVKDFIDAKMKLNTISTSNHEDTGACRGNTGYYKLAKQALMALTDEQIEEFRTNDSYELIVTARARYLAWAKACGDEGYEFIDDFSHITGSNNVSVKPNNTNVALLVTVSCLLVGISLAAFFLARKRRFHK